FAGCDSRCPEREIRIPAPRVRAANFGFGAPEVYTCSCPFDSEVRPRGRRKVCELRNRDTRAGDIAGRLLERASMTAETHLFGCLQDNYGVLVHDKASGATAAIDAPEATPVEAALKKTGWKLTDIFVTHHHGDHTGGIAELKQRHGCRVVAPRNE